MAKKSTVCKVYDIVTERVMDNLMTLGGLYDKGDDIDAAVLATAKQTLKNFADEGTIFEIVDDFGGFGDEEFVTIAKNVNDELVAVKTNGEVLFTAKELAAAWNGVVKTNFCVLNGEMLYFYVEEGMVWKNDGGESLTVSRGTTGRFVMAVWRDGKGASLQVQGDVLSIAAFVFAHKMSLTR